MIIFYKNLCTTLAIAYMYKEISKNTLPEDPHDRTLAIILNGGSHTGHLPVYHTSSKELKVIHILDKT